MAFVLKQSKSYRWPVKYAAPADDEKYDRAEFMAEFKRLPQTRIDDLIKESRGVGIDDDNMVREVLVSWSGIQTADGTEFEFTDANLSTLLATFAGMRAAIIQAFFDSMRGAARKN